MAQTDSGVLAVEVRSATKRYGPVVALREASFELRRGEVHALLGHNGAGKSTMVKVLGGVVTPDQGEVLVGGSPVVLKSPRQAQANGIAVVEQELSLVPTLTVLENILLGSVDAASVDRATVSDLLSKLGLHDVGPETLVEDLSIGERQLVEIARALSRDARVLILDEPTATLAEQEIERVFAAVRELVAEGRSVVFVSHRLGEVLELCDRVTVMRDGQVTVTRDVAGLERSSIVTLMLGEEGTSAVATRSIPARREDLAVIRGLTVPGTWTSPPCAGRSSGSPARSAPEPATSCARWPDWSPTPAAR